MFEDMAAGTAEGSVPEPAPPVTAETIRCWIAGLSRVDRHVDDAERVSRMAQARPQGQRRAVWPFGVLAARRRSTVVPCDDTV